MTERRAALITGASKGIGAAAAVALAAAGYDVAINFSRDDAGARAVAARVEALGVAALLCRCDVSDEPAVRAMADAIGERFGRLDALVNNAGITSRTAPSDFEAMALEDWDRVFAVNVRGIFQVTRAVLPMLRRAPDAAIVNSASIVGLRPGPQPLPYAASKAAVVNLTKTLALHLGPKIRVNAVAPGWMEGDWMKRMLGERYEDLMARRARQTPLKRNVTAADVAETIVSLITANRFVTGEIVVIDGGFASST
ncbi:MAG TPA: SDR family NAD(P)-dependent oxidoreductase [Candidatus Binataceae bacterium]|nr:SDR family NAD(P)-dependent oxidoreductase [Candidatus Binataceae bacterium]